MLDILPFEKLVIHRITLMMYKYSQNTLPPPIMGLFITNNEIHSHNTRNRNSLHTLVGRGEAIYKTFSFRAVLIWNHITDKLPTNISYNNFKKLSKSYISANDIR